MFSRSKVVFLVAITFSVALLVRPIAASPTAPVAAFTYTPAAPILRQIIVFDASASYDPDNKSIIGYKWDFGDGINYTIDVPVDYHNYTTFGTYNVTLEVTDSDNEHGMTWQIVTVREYPDAAFTCTPERPIVDQTATFNASSSIPNGGTIIWYYWNFGDGNTANVTVPVTTHIYANAANRNVTLTVRDSEGLTDMTWQIVTVRDYPVAAFIHSPDRPLVNETVTFDASSSTPDGGIIVSYNWNFGDNVTGAGKNVTHKYAAIGNYNVTLTVADNESLTDTAWDIVTVRKLPFATFTYSPAAPLVNGVVTFNASLSTPDGGTIVSYRWTFGDNTTGTGMIVNHTYTAFGTYTVSLTITDSEDLTDDFSDTVRILIAPVANFTSSPTKPIINQTITFNASASYDPDRSIFSYRWDFRDDSNGTGQITTHAYAAAGTYNVTLTVIDDDGLTNTVWKLITVYTFLYVHDVAITSVTTSTTGVYVGLTVNINVVAKNEGTAVESFNVTLYCNATSVETKKVTNLLPSSEENLTFIWNTAGVALGNYTISARASVVPDETDTGDNTFIDGTVKVRMVGDVTEDGTVDIFDIVYVAISFGTSLGEPQYNPNADVNCDGTIDIFDIVTVGVHFGETYP